jgi:gliding motility-associated-like protein
MSTNNLQKILPMLTWYKYASKALVLLTTFLWSGEADASHIVGGEMTYRCLGGQVYEITLTLRRDCFNGSPEAEFDDPAHIGIFDGEGSIIRTRSDFSLLLLEFRRDDTLNEILKTECEVVGGDVCVHTTTYRGKVELPFIKGGYILAYQRCCRNKTITNITDPELIGATYSVVISEDALRYCNSSPKFKPFPPIYICGDRPIVSDQSATDAEGDSIVYSLCVPYAGADTSNSKPSRPKYPFPEVQYKAPFGLKDLLGGTPPLRIDEYTGLLTGQPNAIGQYLVGICISEYRNGKLLSRVRRDFQYNVRFCTTNPVSNFEADNTVLCVGDSTVRFTNNSINARDYTWLFNFPDTTYISKETHPEFTFPGPGKYRVALVANRAKECIDTNYKDIFIYGEGYLKARFQASYEACRDSIELALSDLSTDSLLNIDTWNWSARLNNKIVTSTQRHPKFVFQDTGTVTISLTVHSEGGCEAYFEQDFVLHRLKPEFVLDKIPICIGESTRLILNPDSRFSYQWSPSEGLNCADCPDPLATPTRDTWYRLVLTDGNCTIEDSVYVMVSTLLNLQIAADTVLCSEEIELQANGGVESTIEWSDRSDFSNILGSGDFKLKATVRDSAIFYVRGKSAFNCPGGDSIIVYNRQVRFNPALDSARICQQDSFELNVVNHVPGQNILYQWEPGSFILEGQGSEKVKIVLPDCGDFPVMVTAINQYLCTDSDTVMVRSVCKPDVGFRVEKNCDNTLVSFTNESAPGNYMWDFGDNESSSEMSPVHFYAKPGRYTVRLTVNSECSNELDSILDIGLIMVELQDRVVSCNGKPVPLNPNANVNYNYSWTPAEGLDDPASPNPTATVSSTKTYKVRVFDKDIPDCFIDREVTVFVPPAIGLQVNSDTILCYTDTLLLKATTDTVVPSIEWTDQIGILLGRGYQLEQVFPDSGWVFAYATDKYGCGDVDSFRVITSHPQYRIEGDRLRCANQDGTIEFINLNAHQYTFRWTASNNSIVTDQNRPWIKIRPRDTTIYQLNFVNEYGCAYSDTFLVNISQFNPPLEAWADPPKIYLGQSTQLNVTPGHQDYTWVIPTNLSCTMCPDPIANPQRSILYQVTAINKDGCKGVADVSVIVVLPKCNEEDVYLPNIFSPNGDGENDILRIRSNFLESVEMYVYDRWGEKVFETKDIQKWWDGTFKGSSVPADVYGYYFVATCTDGQKYAQKGNVTLLR